MASPFQFSADCRHFRFDRPCPPHKTDGRECPGCDRYSPWDTRILIIKLDFLGDVLRTTSILPGLKEKYPASHVTWLTMEASLPLLENLPEIDRVLAVDAPAHAFCAQNLMALEVFDLLVNPDASYRSAGIAERVKAREKRGFGLKADGRVYPFTPEALPWFEMGVNDRLKRLNRETYQTLIARMIGIDGRNMPVLIRLTDAEKAYGRDIFRGLGLDPSRPTLGINAGSGARWPLKRWLVDRYAQIIDRVQAGGRVNVVLIGGPEETAIHARIRGLARVPVADAGTGHTLRNFLGVVDACDVVLTGDTTCMHAACGLKKRVVTLFGPTSRHEIDLYGRGTKVFAETLDCLGCYNGRCDRSPTCMDLISVDQVSAALEPHLRQAEPEKRPA